MFIKNKIENYIKDWKERDTFEKYAIVGYVLTIIILVLANISTESEFLRRLINILPILFLTLMFKRIKKTKQEVVAKNKEIEEQKRLIEEHQKEIIDSIHYARRIQTSLLPTEKYIERILNEINNDPKA